jgi:hypothetical protein
MIIMKASGILYGIKLNAAFEIEIMTEVYRNAYRSECKIDGIDLPSQDLHTCGSQTEADENSFIVTLAWQCGHFFMIDLG